MVEEITIPIFNEKVTIEFSPVWCRIISENSQELHEYLHNKLAYRPDGYFFSPKYQNGIWDGYSRLYKANTKRFRVGLLTRVVNLLQESECDINVIDFPDSNIKELKTDKYKNAKGEKVTLRDYQKEAILTALEKRIGIIQAPPRSGKTLIATAIIDNENQFPVNFFVRSKDLAYQTLEVFKQNFIDKSLGFICDGVCEIGDINIVTIQSAFSAYNKKYKEKGLTEEKDVINKVEVKNLIRDARAVFPDECFPGGTLIHIDENTQASIKEIYNSPAITHVLSYNEVTGELERKKILRRIKKEADKSDMFFVKTIISEKETLVKCTSNHKFWTQNRGMIPANELTIFDTLKVLPKASMLFKKRKDIICEVCEREFGSSGAYKNHFYFKHTKEGIEKKKNAIKNTDYEKMVKERNERGIWNKSLKEMGKRRRGKDNPVNRYPGTKKKISDTHKKLFKDLPEEKQLEQIIRFKNAPKFKGKMTKPEKRIEDFRIEGLVYTGNGFYNKNNPFAISILLNGKKKKKIPDFTCFSEKKVIEVMDFEYWHKKEEIEPLMNAYKEKVKLEVFKFLYNHNVPFTEKGYIKSSFRKTVEVYDLEVEDNHNYFANGFLVSNCHHLSSDTSKFILDKSINATMKIGLSATPFSDRADSILVEEVIGPVIYQISYSELVKTNFLMRPYIYMYKLPKTNLEGTYRAIYTEAVVKNEFLSNLIQGLVKKLNEMGKSVVIQTEYVQHSKDLAKKLGCEYLTGSDTTEKRQRIIKDLTDKKIICLVSTLFEEGLDIFSLDYTINLAGGLSNISTFQRMRSITAHESKTTIGIIDFIHQCKYLKKHSNKRLKLYTSEPEFVVEIRDVSKKNIEELFS